MHPTFHAGMAYITSWLTGPHMHHSYDLEGKKIAKSGREKDRLDKFLAKMDDPDYGRTIVDPLTKREIVLTDEEVDMIKRIQGGK